VERDQTAAMDLARSMWLRLETVHAVTYFGQETTDAGAGLGLGGFWAGYFAFRAAPMGPVAPGVVEATFFNFAPTFVRRWVPDVWDRATPDVIMPARSAAAATTLRRVHPDVADAAAIVNPILRRAAGEGVAAGRPLFAANRTLDVPADPVEELWHWTTCLREHRGDGHVAALTAAGVDGLQAHVLIALEQGASPEDLQRTRGWTADDWSDAVARCRDRGWVDASGTLTDIGRAVRLEVEATTDRLATQPFDALAAADAEVVLRTLTPVAIAISSSGTIRYPNPMGLPAAHELLAD